MTSIRIETDTNRAPTSAAATPPMITANVSHPGTATLTIKRRAVLIDTRPPSG